MQMNPNAVDSDMDLENQAGEMAARGRLDNMEEEGAIGQAPDEELGEALHGATVHNEIVSQFDVRNACDR